MSCTLAVQAARHGGITALDLFRQKHLVASLIREKFALVDYSRQLRFQTIEAAIEFYTREQTIGR